MRVWSVHGPGQHVDHAAAHVDVEGEEGLAGEIAQGLERLVESCGGFLVEGEVYGVVDAVALRFHRANERPSPC